MRSEGYVTLEHMFDLVDEAHPVEVPPFDEAAFEVALELTTDPSDAPEFAAEPDPPPF